MLMQQGWGRRGSTAWPDLPCARPYMYHDEFHMRKACLRQPGAACRLCRQSHCLVNGVTSTSCSWAGRWTAFTLLDSVRARSGCRTPVTKWEGRVGSGLHTAAEVNAALSKAWLLVADQISCCIHGHISVHAWVRKPDLACTHRASGLCLYSHKGPSTQYHAAAAPSAQPVHPFITRQACCWSEIVCHLSCMQPGHGQDSPAATLGVSRGMPHGQAGSGSKACYRQLSCSLAASSGATQRPSTC